MFCLNCGKQIDDHARFCPYCGSVTAGAAPNTAPAAAPAEPVLTSEGTRRDASTPVADPSTPAAPAGKRTFSKRPGLLIPVIAAAVVIVVALAILLGGLFGGAKGTVAKAFIKTAEAYSSVADQFGLSTALKMVSEKKFSQNLAVELTDVNSMLGSSSGDLEGLGLRLTTDVNIPGESLGLSVTPFYDSADLLTAQLLMDGSKIYFASPELLKDTVPGVDTKTLGKDLLAAGAEADGIESISFNTFQVIKKAIELTAPSKDNKKVITDAAAQLANAIEVEKVGKKAVSVNKNRVDCTAYTVMIPQDAMEDFIKAAASTVEDVDYEAICEELMTMCGFPQDVIEDVLDELAYELDDMSAEDYADEFVDAMEEILDILGDLELEVCIKDGYIMSVVYDEKIDGEKIKLSINLGGGKNYVDDMSVKLNVDDELEIIVTSTGDHSAKSGTFTDETTIEVTDGSTEEIVVETSYAPKKKDNNFSWSIDSSYFTAAVHGQLNAGSSSLEALLHEVELEVYGMSVGTASVDYSLNSYKKSISMKSPTMLSKMTEDDVMDLFDAIEENASEWAMDILKDIPVLEYLF